MQQERSAQPPAYTQHDPSSLNLPSVPTHTLPSLRSLDLPDASPGPATHSSRASIELSPKTTSTQWGPLPPLSSATFPRVPEGDVGSPMDTASVVSGVEERRREMSVLSVDDPDVRLAAEALSGLGNPGAYKLVLYPWMLVWANAHGGIAISSSHSGRCGVMVSLTEAAMHLAWRGIFNRASLASVQHANSPQTSPDHPPPAPSPSPPANPQPSPSHS